MHSSKNQTDFYKQQLLSVISKSKEEFIKEYRKYEEKQAKQLYLQILTELKEALSIGDLDSFKNLCRLIDYISKFEKTVLLRAYYDNTDNQIERTNLVILACKHNKVKILEYLFVNDCNILNNLSIDIGNTTISPNNEDEECHNAFYYSIRSGNVDLLDTLINKWPGNYFANHSEELDDILARTYEELKLKNVELSENIQVFVENKLINLRFFPSSIEDKSVDPPILEGIKILIEERINLILENIKLLKFEYSDTKIVDEKFLFVCKFIAKNIDVLKRQFKSTYDNLPLEEIEFCLVSFVSSHTKYHEINLFYRFVLNKEKVLTHLENFAKILDDEKRRLQTMDFRKLHVISRKKREKVVADIIRKCPVFEELYDDYKQIRDVYSLEKTSTFIELALSVDSGEKEGQLIIIRALQVIGEYLKNTLESPNLSRDTSDFLLLSVSKNTKEIITDLRDLLSHGHSLSKRTEIEENVDDRFFNNIQNDLKKINIIIADIIYNNKIKIIGTLIKKIVDSENLDELRETVEALRSVELDKIILEDIETREYEKIRELIKELSDRISEKTNYEKELFNRINNIIHNEKTSLVNSFKMNYILGVSLLKELSTRICSFKMDDNIIRGIKFHANKALEIFTPKTESKNLRKIVKLAAEISISVSPRLQHDSLNEISGLIYKIFYISEFEIDHIKWIEELRTELNKNKCKKGSLSEKKYSNLLSLKLSTLTDILSRNALNNQLVEKFSSYKSNKKLQIAIEMLVLDIISVLDSSKNCLINNLLFLDDNSPLLIGRCLRNYLAHGNALIDVLLIDPSIAVISNAKILTAENLIMDKYKIGKLNKDDPSKLKDRYDQGLVIITNQEKMFVALEEGNLKDLKSCVKKGADISARSINLWTTLHFAAKGSSLEVVKFILDRNLTISLADINGQNPLHIAAVYGRKSVVELFVEERGVNVDTVDNNGKTSLHLAAQNGHKDTVEILLKKKANTNIKDRSGISPLHYAVQNNHKDVVEVLLQKERNVDINEASGGFTSLHIAAESGYLELVNLLIKNKANVNAKNDKNGIPLHTAALNGHLEVVKTLITNGADVNAKILGGYTALHYAVETGYEKTVKFLLEHGAVVNVADNMYNNIPLHYAAKDGYRGIVEVLLQNKANVNAVTIEGVTPLHFAAQSGHTDIVHLLIENKAIVNAKNKNGITALHLSTQNSHNDIVRFIINKGAKIDARSKDNWTSLQVAARNGSKEIVDILTTAGADINTIDDDGSTTLHLSALNSNADVVEVLIKKGANVNAKDKHDRTPLHLAAAMTGNERVVKCLLQNGANVNAKEKTNSTPLHIASLNGNKEVVEALIERKTEVNAKNKLGYTPLHLAVEGNHKEIIEALIKKKATVNNIDNRDFTPLCSAVEHNYEDIVKVLITNEADVNAQGGRPLLLAVIAGYTNIVETLLKNENINIQTIDSSTLFPLAAKKGHKGIVEAFLAKGYSADAITDNNATPLHFAAHVGHKEVCKALLEKGVNVNARCSDGTTPLHIAVLDGHSDVVDVLLNYGANISITDNKNRIPIELAVAHGHLQIVKTLLQNTDVNAAGNDNWTVLHIAAQEGSLEITKYLIEKGADRNAKNYLGSKPIHIAAREGHKNIVEFFLKNGCSINDLGAANCTLLHYAASGGQLEVSKYLIEQKIDVNAADGNGSSPIHAAANGGYKDVIEVLLNNGAIYNAVDKLNRKPSEVALKKDVIILLASNEKLFRAVKHNSPLDVENCIKEGAFINAINTNSVMPLHYATWKGYGSVVDVLLKYKANPNAIGKGGCTPLHYAAKFNHVEIVKALLSNGAMYNVMNNNGKTPLDFAVNQTIIYILKSVNESFENVKNSDLKIINDLKKIKDVDTVKAIMNACDRENKTLIVAAIHNDFPKVEQLKQVLQDGLSAQLDMANLRIAQERYQEALTIFKKILEKRTKILGPDNPGTLDIQTCIAKVLYKEANYQEALNILEEIYRKQKKMLGFKNKDTLRTRSSIALVLHRQGKYQDALSLFKEIYQKQKQILGSSHSDILDTQLHMALVLDNQGKYEEALNINYEVFEKRKEILGLSHPCTLSTQNNIAMVLNNQGKHEEALKTFKNVYETRKIILGPRHSDTLRTLQSIAGVFSRQGKNDKALKTLQHVFDMQKDILGPGHLDTLRSQYNIANLLFSQGKYIAAYKGYIESFDQTKVLLGPNHPVILDILNKIDMIYLRFKVDGSLGLDILQHIQNGIIIAANNGDAKDVEDLIENGVDVNIKDTDGRTPLNFAINNGHKDTVDMLLKHGADATKVTNKGNTSLHTATSKGYKEIVDVLLQYVEKKSPDKFTNFINAKTTVGGTTSLHVAAKTGSLEIVTCLLKHGAIYNATDKNNNKTPLDYSINQNVTDLLKLVEKLFDCAKNGDSKIISWLNVMNPDEFASVINARNIQEQTLLQVSLYYKHKDIASSLVKYYKKINCQSL